MHVKLAASRGFTLVETLVAMFVLAVGGAVILTFMGTDIITSLSGSVSAMGNMGPALGEAGPASNFLVFPRAGRMLLAVLMLVGRLEVFPMVLVAVSAARRRGEQ